MNEDKKKKHRRIVLYIAIILILAVFIIKSVITIADDRNSYKGKVTNVQEFFIMKNSYLFIPTGNIYYYIADDVETGETVVFRAAKNYLEKYGNGTRYIEGDISSVSTKAYDYIKTYAPDAIYGYSKAVNTEAKKYAYQTLIMIGVVIIFCIAGIIMSKKHVFERNKNIGIIFGVLIVCLLVYMVHFITMI